MQLGMSLYWRRHRRIEIIRGDRADWMYVPAGKGVEEVKPAEIGEEIKTKLNEEVALTLTK